MPLDQTAFVPQGYFLTVFTWQRRTLFSDPKACEMLLHVWLYNKFALQYRIWGFVVMPDHLHMLFFPEKVPASQVVRKNTANFTRFYRFLRPEILQVWDDDYFLIPINGSATIRQVQAFMDANPVRSGLVSDSSEYPHSSFTVKHTKNPQWTILLDRQLNG